MSNDTVINYTEENVFVFPVSFAQQRLWFLDQLLTDSPLYNIPGALHLKGKLNIQILEQSFNEIVRRHESLRTTFTTVNGRPVQVISNHLTLPLTVVEFQHLEQTQQQTQLQQVILQQIQQPFDLKQGPLLRANLLQIGEQEYILVLTMHHIIADGWSMGVLIREMLTLYPALIHHQPSPLLELPIQYVDFTHWQQEWLQGEVLKTQLSYWGEKLAGAPDVLNLASDGLRPTVGHRLRPPVQTFLGATQSLHLSKSLSTELQTLSQRQGVTLFMTLLAAFKVLLFRYTGQTDILVGSPIANRNRTEIEGLIGFFVNTLVLRSDLSGSPSFLDLLQQVRETTLSAYAHQDLPFEKLVEELKPRRDLSYTPLFQVMFILQNAPIPPLELEGLTLTPLEFDNQTAKFDLTLSMMETKQGLQASLEYNTDLFDAATVARIGEHYQILLQGIVKRPEQPITTLPILTNTERQLFEEWHQTQQDYPQQCVQQLFEHQVERTPDVVAVVFGNDQLTYHQLNQRANQLAHHLQMLGIQPDVPVGLCLERSTEMVIGLLAILKAGGAYVPLDPTYPSERLRYILENTQMPVLLTQSHLLANLPEQAIAISLDTDWSEISQYSATNPNTTVTPDHLAYVIYTSGSTGKPKGVAMPHRPLTNLLCWQLRNSVVSAGKTLQFTSINFDVSFQEIFSTLGTGGTLVLVSEDTRRDPLSLLQLLNQDRIERLFLPFVALQHLADVAVAEEIIPTSLKEIITAGEQLQITPSISQLFNKLPNCRLHNHYGPSETHVVTAFTLPYVVTEWATLPPIGRAIANTQIYLLDSQKQIVPIGVAGEIYIGGECLARGYLHQPELTNERFITHTWNQQSSQRLYKTGDLARYLSNGDIEYLGRLDNQVKIRGFRIELGEVEIALSQHPSVKKVVVIDREDTPRDRRLVAYVVADQEISLTTNELQGFLTKKLPNYMIPTDFVLLATLPFLPNGKVDRRALPAPDMTKARTENSFCAPRNPIEEVLAEIWSKILGLEQVGIHDNFFELGGHSLLATQVISQIRRAFQVELPLRSLFEMPTVAGLAQAIAQINNSEISSATIKPVARETNRIKLSSLMDKN